MAADDFLSSILSGGGVLGPDRGGFGVLSSSNPTTNFALSLLANSGPTRLPTTFGQAVGESAIQANDMAAQNAMRRAQLAQAYLGLQAAQNRQNIISRIANGGSAQPDPSQADSSQPDPFAPQASSAGGALGAPVSSGLPPPLIRAPGVQASAPQPAQYRPTPQTQAANQDSPLAPWLPVPGQQQIYSQPIGPASANDALALAVASGKDLATAQEAIRAQQLQQAQRQYAGQIQALDSVVQSDNPSRDVRASQVLSALWQRYAQARGFNPDMSGKDFTDANLRQVFGGAANQYRAALSEPTIAPPVSEQLIPGPLNSLLAFDPRKGTYSTLRPEESLHQVDLGNGQHPYLPASQAAGKQSFNATLFGVGNLSTDAKDLAYQYWKQHGSLPVSFSRSPAASAELLNDFAARAKAEGDTGASIAASQAAYKSGSAALVQNDKLRTASGGYYGTLERNLDNLVGAYQKAGSAGSPLLNRALRAWQQHVSGDPDTAAMVTWLNAAQSEFAKLKSGSLGNAPASDQAMRDAAEVINKSMTQGGIEAVRDAMLAEGKNRIDSIDAESARLKALLGGNAPAAAGSSSSRQPVRISSDADYNALPRGATFIAPDGTTRRKP